MSEKDSILPKFREYRYIVQDVEAKHQSNDKYKQNLSMNKIVEIHTAVLESYGRVTLNKFILKTGLRNS